MSKSLVSFVGLMLLTIGYSGVGNFIRTLSARLAHPKMTDRA